MEIIKDGLSLVNHIVQVIELLFFGTIAAVIGVSLMPKDNPLHALLVSLTKHLAATLALGVIAIPMQPIPGVDVAYDAGSAIFLLFYWGSFAMKLLADPSMARPPAPMATGRADADDRPGLRTILPGAPLRRPASDQVIDVEPTEAPFRGYEGRD
jgi:hypothetical protein